MVTGGVDIAGPRRPRVAFFGYSDVFEDFYPHYGVDQDAFATRFAGTGNHAFVSLLQREIADVVWYEFALRPALEEARHEVVGCRVRMLRSSWAHRLLWRAFYLPKMAWRWRGAYRAYATVASYLAPLSLAFFRALTRDRPDVILAQSYASGRFDLLLLVSRLLGVPLIAYHAGGRPEQYLGGVIRKWTLPRADCLIASGADERDMLATRFRVSRTRVVVILTPIDTIAFHPIGRTAACEAAGLSPARRHILFVGRLDDKVKRVNALIQSFARIAFDHPDVDLVIVGEGPDSDKLRRFAEETAPGRVRFLGWMSGASSLRPLYNSAECLVLCSWREGFPTVLGEAMSCGTPVLSSRVGAVRELITEGETGWTFTAGDDEALTAVLARVLSHPEALRAMRPAVREHAVARLSEPIAVAGLRECFLEAGVRHLFAGRT
jgi:glycosyltransferase involved in cell wall biosynthesis